MGDRIFISHANKDKPNIGAIICHLLEAGFKLFIDHPEKISGIDRKFIDGNIIRSLSDIGGGRTTGYTERLNQELRESACVVGILSENISNKNGVLLGEFQIAQYEQKLIMCKISEPKTEMHGAVAQYDITPLDLKKYDREVYKISLDNLVRYIRQLLKSTNGHERRQFATFDLIERSCFRELHDRAPLRMGRTSQVQRISMAVRRIGEPTKEPMVLIGPKNELPHRLPECVNYELEGTQIGAQSSYLIAVKIEWPSGFGADFQAVYQEWLSKALLRRPDATCADIAKAMIDSGRPHLFYSNVYVDEGKYNIVDVERWTSFWNQIWPDELKKSASLAPTVLPLLNVVFKEANPGWDSSEPWIPPSQTEDANARSRNVAILTEVRRLLPSMPEKPVSTWPIRSGDFDEWVTSLDLEIIGNRDRQALRTIGTELFKDEPIPNQGIPHQKVHARAAEWIKNAIA